MIFCESKAKVLAKVERIGEAKTPGPGAHRLHKRGKRSLEADAARRRNYFRKETVVSRRCEDSQDAQEETKAKPFHPEHLCVWHINIQGLRSHVAELAARLRMREQTPHVLCYNETFLEESVEDVQIESYMAIASWDRAKERGGVCVNTRQDVAQQVTLLQKSADAERIWCVLHTGCGPYLLGSWYRPPANEMTSMETCEKEHAEFSEGILGTLLVGDINVRNEQWPKHSRETTAGGKHMRCADAHMGLNQIVKEPTRTNQLLDLLLTDVQGTTACALPRLADQTIVEVSTSLPVPREEVVFREGWGMELRTGIA